MRRCCCSSTSTGRCCCGRAPSTRRRCARRWRRSTAPRRASAVSAAGRTDTAIARDLAALGGRQPAAFRRGPRRVHGGLRRGVRAALPGRRCASGWRPGWPSCSTRSRARGEVRRSLVTGNYEAGRPAQARARRDRPALRARPGRLRVGRRASRRAASHRARARRRLSARAHDRDRRHAAGHRLRARRRPARARGGDRPLRGEELTGADAVAADGFELAGLLERELERCAALASARGACR